MTRTATSTGQPLSESLRGAFEALAASGKVAEPHRSRLLLAYDDGRDDQIAVWAERLDGDPEAASGRGDVHARGLLPDVRRAVAARRRHTAGPNHRQAA